MSKKTKKACIYFDASWRPELREVKFAAVALPYGPSRAISRRKREPLMTPEFLRDLELIAYRTGFERIEPGLPYDATQAEACAYRLAVSLGRELLRKERTERVLLYGDDQPLLGKLRKDCPFELSWIPREQNRLAHSLANWSCRGGLLLMPHHFALPSERV